MTPVEITELLKMLTSLALLLRQQGVSPETIEASLKREWDLADKLNAEINK